MTDPTRSRLLAILAADGVGYSRLMSLDDHGTLTALDAARAIFRRHIEGHGGRVIDMAGDAVLAVFETATAAVQTALAVQSELANMQPDAAPDRRLRHRVGIHLGDVLEKADGTVYGNGVNIAARLEGLCEAGGVVVSQSVLDVVESRVQASFTDLGEHRVKNIARPVRAFSVGAAGAWPAAGAGSASVPRRGKTRAWIGATGLGLALAAVLAWWQPWQGVAGGPRPSTATSPATVERPSIAVMPFANATGRAEDAYLADGLHEEILNALSRLPALKVISRGSVLEYRGKAVGAREVGKRLDATVVLEGSVRRDGTRLRLSLQLVDARDDRQLLAANYDRELTDVLTLQGEVARQVAQTLVATLTSQQRGLLARVGTTQGDAYDRYLRARALFNRRLNDDPDTTPQVRQLLQEALRLDPDFADALAMMSRVHSQAYAERREPTDATEAQRAYERALTIDPRSLEARLARGLYMLNVASDPRGAVSELDAVVREQPGWFDAQHALADALMRSGQVAKSLEHELLAQDLDPLSQETGPIFAILGLRRYPEALAQFDLRVRRFPSQIGAYVTKARVEARMQSSVEPLRAVLRLHGERLPPGRKAALEAEIAQGEGRYLDAVPLWEAVPDTTPLMRGLRSGILHLAAGDAAGAERQFRLAESWAREMMSQTPPKSLGRGGSRGWPLLLSLMGQHQAALEAIDAMRKRYPESTDPIFGPQLSFTRSVILVRAGRKDEGYAEVARLLRTPFGDLEDFWDADPLRVLLKDDPKYDELINRPPRL